MVTLRPGTSIQWKIIQLSRHEKSCCIYLREPEDFPKATSTDDFKGAISITNSQIRTFLRHIHLRTCSFLLHPSLSLFSHLAQKDLCLIYPWPHCGKLLCHRKPSGHTIKEEFQILVLILRMRMAFCNSGSSLFLAFKKKLNGDLLELSDDHHWKQFWS